MLFVVKVYFLVAAMPRDALSGKITAVLCTTIRHLLAFLERFFTSSVGYFVLDIGY